MKEKNISIILLLWAGTASAQTFTYNRQTVYYQKGTDAAIAAAIKAIPKQTATITQSTIDSIVNVIATAVNARFVEVLANYTQYTKDRQAFIDTDYGLIEKNRLQDSVIKVQAGQVKALTDSVAKIRPVWFDRPVKKGPLVDSVFIK